VRRKPSRKPVDSPAHIAAGEQTVSVRLVAQLKRVDQSAMDLIANLMGESKTFEIPDTGLMAVCFRISDDAAGELLYGCLCAMVTAAGLNVEKLHQVAVMQNMILQRARLKSSNGSRRAPAANEEFSKAELREKQTIATQRAWTVLRWLLHEPAGSRMNRMAERARDLFEILEQNPALASVANGSRRRARSCPWCNRFGRLFRTTARGRISS